MATIDRGDAQIWWQAEGDGEPLLLIMGLGYSSDMWWRLLPELTPRFEVIRFDNRGTGRTGVPPGPYSIDLMLDDALAVLEAAGHSSAHVLGASLGGFIAQEMVLRHPEKVRSLVLACTHAGPERMAPLDPAAVEMAMSRASMSPEEAAEVAIPFVYAKSTPRSVIDEDFEVRLRIPTSPEGYSNQLAGSLTWAGSGDRLKDVKVPTLIVQGLEDRFVVPENAEIFAGLIPGSKLVMIEDASHILFSDQPQAVAKAVTEFLDSL